MPLQGMQMKLFDDIDDPPRPSLWSEEVSKLVAERILPEIVKWMKPRFPIPESELEEMKTEICEAIEFTDDSYEIARELETRSHWDVDRDLIHIMDSVSEYRYQEHNKIVNQWVLSNGVEPKLKIDDVVSFKTNDLGVTSGKITSIFEKTANYGIRLDNQPNVVRLVEYERVSLK